MFKGFFNLIVLPHDITNLKTSSRNSSLDFCNTLFSNDIVLERFGASEGLKLCSDRCNCRSDLRNCRYLLLMSIYSGDMHLIYMYISASSRRDKFQNRNVLWKPSTVPKQQRGKNSLLHLNSFTLLHFAVNGALSPFLDPDTDAAAGTMNLIRTLMHYIE